MSCGFDLGIVCVWVGCGQIKFIQELAAGNDVGLVLRAAECIPVAELTQFVCCLVESA